MRQFRSADVPDAPPHCGGCANALHFGDPRFVACICRLEYRPAANQRVCEDFVARTARPRATWHNT